MVALGLQCCGWLFSSCEEWGLFPSCSVWASHCSGFSCCGAWGLGHGFRGCGAQFSCPAICGIFPGQGIGTHVPCIGRQILTHWTTREVLCSLILIREISPWWHWCFQVVLFHFSLKTSHCPLSLSPLMGETPQSNESPMLGGCAHSAAFKIGFLLPLPGLEDMEQY